jgi:NADPH:quinone reductase-like Zn-dependent oxidoreductase
MTPSLQLQSTVRNDGMLEITLASVELASPGPDEVIIKVEASPINPSDLGLLFGPADIGAAINSGTGSQRFLSAPIPEKLRASVSVRAGQPLPVGNEGAGVVVEAGGSESAQALLGRTVAVFGGGMYAQYRCVAAATCLPLPSGTSARDGASCFVNPLTVLGMVETMRMESHVGLIHTVGASNLGQMLIKVCLADGVPLVNIVRSPEQVEMLKDLGAEHVCNSSADSFRNDLVAALEKTEATLAFDAIAGGALASQILTAMERVAGRDSAPSNRYGSTTHKQVYLYGGLDVSPTVLKRNYGMAWGVGGWLLPNFLVRIGADKGNELRGRVANEIKTTFACH